MFQRRANSFTTPEKPKKTRKSRLRRKTGSEDESPSPAVTPQPAPAAAVTSVSSNLTRRRKKMKKESAGAYSTSCLIIAMATALSCIFFISFGFLLFLETENIPQKKSVENLLRGASSPIQERLRSIERNWAGDEDRNANPEHQQRHAPKTIAKDEETIVDMRQLNYELPFDNPDGGVWKQGWNIEPKTGPLKVYVIPHSHCDPGWIKTFDEYFQRQTKQIITTVIQSLAKDERRKFIWAEISYFEWWWNEQDEETRKLTRRLLENHQLEFVTGGWVQPDEANSELYAMEIQLQEGHDWIRKTFGEEYIPHYGWAIDPFGYSPTMAWLLQKYGFRAMLIQRVHYAVKKELAKRKHLEFYWRQTWDSGQHDIFTHVMPFYSYDVPHTCGPDPSVCCQFDFKRRRGQCPWRKDPVVINDSNVHQRAMLLWDQYQKKAALYRSNTVLVPLGDDFRYETSREAQAQYDNYQKIFDYINANVPGAKVQFGTLSEYFQDVMGTFDAPILKGSFFTYSDVNHDYWSGYFTSRVFDKALDRQLERTLYAAESMGGTKEELQLPRRALSLFQHHDGVTGTAKTHVVEDYAKRMFDAIQFTQEWMIKHITETQSDLRNQVVANANLAPCWKSRAARDMNQNVCKSDVLLYNPLATPQKCGSTVVEGHFFAKGSLPCEVPGKLPSSSESKFVFDSRTGMMIEPIQEHWKFWRVHAGGAYLFVPGEQVDYTMSAASIEDGGYVVNTPNWKRTVVEREIPSEFGSSSTVIDFIFETDLKTDNEEWFVRFSSNVANNGVFHTDLNGFNFDTHRFRSDMPIQSQVFPMPTLASIEDDKQRMTVLSEHAQGTASLENGSIDVWLDRRLRQDDNRGLGQGVQDNRRTRTRLRVVVEEDGYKSSDGEFDVTPLGRRMWDELQHPLEMFGQD